MQLEEGPASKDLKAALNPGKQKDIYNSAMAARVRLLLSRFKWKATTAREKV
jgi:hypothetical protein